MYWSTFLFITIPVFLGGVGKRFLAHPFVLLLKALNLDMDVTKDVLFFFTFYFSNLEDFVKKELESICLINANLFCLLVKVSFFSSMCYCSSTTIFRRPIERNSKSFHWSQLFIMTGLSQRSLFVWKIFVTMSLFTNFHF